VNASNTFLIKNGIGTDLSVFGTLVNSGSIAADDSVTISIASSGLYIHDSDGSAIPISTWITGSTCEITGVINSNPANSMQNYSNFRWSCPGQTAGVNLEWDGISINGNLTIENTGSGLLSLCSPTIGNGATVTIVGDLIQSGGTLTANISEETGYNCDCESFRKYQYHRRRIFNKQRFTRWHRYYNMEPQ